MNDILNNNGFDKLYVLQVFLSQDPIFSFHSERLKQHLDFLASICKFSLSPDGISEQKELAQKMHQRIFNYGLDPNVSPNTDKEVEQLLAYLDKLVNAIKEYLPVKEWTLVLDKIQEWIRTWQNILFHRKNF